MELKCASIHKCSPHCCQPGTMIQWLPHEGKKQTLGAEKVETRPLLKRMFIEKEKLQGNLTHSVMASFKIYGICKGI